MATKLMLTCCPQLRNILQPSLQLPFKITQVAFHRTSYFLQDEETPVQNQQRKFSLSFEEYQKLKRSIKTKQRIAGIPFAFAGITACSFTMAYLNPDMFDATPESVQLIMGLDPLVLSGVSGVVSGGLGYVLGVNIFKWAWSVMNKETSHNLYVRDTDFLNRLDKQRFGEDSKFEDDYYGESIKTLSDYRQWVRTHQRKRETNEKFKISQLSTTKEEKLA